MLTKNKFNVRARNDSGNVKPIFHPVTLSENIVVTYCTGLCNPLPELVWYRRQSRDIDIILNKVQRKIISGFRDLVILGANDYEEVSPSRTAL